MEDKHAQKRKMLGHTGNMTKPTGCYRHKHKQGATRPTTTTGLGSPFWQKGQQAVAGWKPEA